MIGASDETDASSDGSAADKNDESSYSGVGGEKGGGGAAGGLVHVCETIVTKESPMSE